MATALVADPPGWAEYLRFRGGFLSLLDPRKYTAAWLDGEVWSGRIILFSGADSAILVRVKPYPTGFLSLEGEAATGNLSEIVGHLIPQAIAFGRSIGCGEAVIESRSGWAKVMRKHGWQLHQQRLTLDL
ncbi:hypothetical protein [Sphingobium olei]|uniref:GNAT family N-acetyltransferase n=1 Tax=Sphingobium olei TaxID=420955 RepID=A0ABW3NXS4_9SPHN